MIIQEIEVNPMKNLFQSKFGGDINQSKRYYRL